MSTGQELVQVDWLLSLEGEWAGEMFSRAGTAGSPPSSSPTPYSSQQSPAPNLEAENVLLAFPSSFAASCGHRTPRLCRDKETACQCRRCKGCGSIPGSGRSLLVGNDHPLQWFLSRKFHGQRSLVGYGPWGHKESDTTERLHTHTLMLHTCCGWLCKTWVWVEVRERGPQGSEMVRFWLHSSLGCAMKTVEYSPIRSQN